MQSIIIIAVLSLHIATVKPVIMATCIQRPPLLKGHGLCDVPKVFAQYNLTSSKTTSL